MTEAPVPSPEPRVRLGRRYTIVLAATLACWTVLVGALVYLVYARTAWVRQADQAHLREWLDESRVFRKTLPDLVAEYIELRDAGPAADESEFVARKAGEIREQIQALTDPLRMYPGALPLFPDVFRVEVLFPGSDWPAIEWASPVPVPRPQN